MASMPLRRFWRLFALPTRSSPTPTPIPIRSLKMLQMGPRFSFATHARSEGLSQRLRRLLRENGKVALGVYLALSALDLSLSFFVVYSFGADHVRNAEDWVLRQMEWKRQDDNSLPETALDLVKDKVGSWAGRKQLEHEKAKDEASKQSGSDAMWASLVLAYTIHKTLLLPVRIGLTAAVTPWTMRYLKRLGFNVGPAVAAAKAAKSTVA